MSASKVRLTITIDPTMAEQVSAMVADGRAESVSSWISGAIAEKAEREQRLAALASAIQIYEAEHGEITDAEIREQVRQDRAAAAKVATSTSAKATKSRKRSA